MSDAHKPLPPELEALLEKAVMDPESLTPEERQMIERHPDAAHRLLALQEMMERVGVEGARYRERILAAASAAPSPREAELEAALRRQMNVPEAEPHWRRRRAWLLPVLAAACLAVAALLYWQPSEDDGGVRADRVPDVRYLSSEGDLVVELVAADRGEVILSWNRVPGLFTRIALADGSASWDVDAPTTRWILPRDLQPSPDAPLEVIVEVHDALGGVPEASARLRLRSP